MGTDHFQSIRRPCAVNPHPAVLMCLRFNQTNEQTMRKDNKQEDTEILHGPKQNVMYFCGPPRYPLCIE